MSGEGTLAAEQAARLALRTASPPTPFEADDPVGADVLRLVERARRAAASSGANTGVLVLAGGTGSDGAAQVRSYKEPLISGLAWFRGTLISGATTVGIAALAGDLREAGGDGIRAVGYAPARTPADVTLETNPNRIDEVRHTSGVGFGVAEPLAYWRDILDASVPPGGVHVIGIGGGPISRAEYLIAAALGARVGLVRGSGRAADALLAQPGEAARAIQPLSGDADSFARFAAAGTG